MKKIISLLLMLSLCFAAFADVELVTSSFSGGYSSTYNLGSIGVNCSYQYLADVSPSTSVGFFSSFDAALNLGRSSIPVSVGSILGVGIECKINQSSSISIGIGPAIYLEADKDYEFIGIGPGASLMHTYYFDSNGSFGLTVGVNAYGQLLNYDDSERLKSMSAYVNGIIGFTFRFEDSSMIPSLPLSPALILY